MKETCKARLRPAEVRPESETVSVEMNKILEQVIESDPDFCHTAEET